VGSAPLWTPGGLWPPSSSSSILVLLPILVLCLRSPPRPPPPSSPSSLFFSLSSSSSFSLSSSSSSVLFVVVILLVWWLWGTIRGRGVRSFAGGLVIRWSCCPVSCCHGGRSVGVCCCTGCIVVVVVGLGCHGWVVVVVFGLSWWWLCCGGGGCTVVVVSWPSLCMRWAWLLVIPPVWHFLVVVSSTAGAFLSPFATPELSCIVVTVVVTLVAGAV